MNHKISRTIILKRKYIDQALKYKYLGSVISENERFGQEIVAKISNLNRIFNLMKDMFLRKREIPKE